LGTRFIVTPIVNYFLFGLEGGIAISLPKIPIFLIVTLVVFGVEKGFSTIPQKWIRWSLAILPFVVMLITILVTYLR